MESCKNVQLKPQKADKNQRTKIGTKNQGNIQKTVANIVHTNPTISTIISNVNDLNIRTERQKVSEWIKKYDPIMLLVRNIL